jgi:tRNA A-37 threonylcarbamoyl transferase component Bud32/TolB-like protein
VPAAGEGEGLARRNRGEAGLIIEMVGATLSHYRVLELLGRGGMGEVYAAEDLKLKRRVALKVLPADMAENHERRRRFEREAQAVAALNHPGIVTIYSVEHENDTSFLTMELVEGRTLDQVVPASGMAPAEFLRIAIQLADALHAAHERGILHRDLKPGNVMLTREGRIKVLDFGLAKLADAPLPALQAAGPLTTTSGQIVGTLSYMAPEQAEGRSIDQRADVFGLGVLLYELLAGIRPFGGESNVALLTSLLRDTPRPIDEVRPGLPPGFAGIVGRCLEKDPARRYQSAAELRADLEALQASTGPVLRRPLPAWVVPAVITVIVLLTGAIAWFGLRTAQSLAAAPVAGASAETAVLITGRQVAMLDFANRTGDPALDAFGRAVSELLATSFASEGIPVVSAMEASAADGLTLAGTYSLEGSEVRFDVRLMSASRGTVVRALEPIRAPRGSLPLGADLTRQRIVPAVLEVFASQEPR